MFIGFIVGIILGWEISKLAPWLSHTLNVLVHSKFIGDILSLLLDSPLGIFIPLIPLIIIALVASYILGHKIANNFLKGVLIAYYVTIFPGFLVHLLGPNADDSAQQALGMILIFIYPLYLITIVPLLLLIHFTLLKKWQNSPET